MKSIVRKVRSKSPFRRRKRAETLVAEVREKEAEYVSNLNNNFSSLRGQDAISSPEIEVVLETTKQGEKQQNSCDDCAEDTSPPKNETVPDVTSSSVSTEEPTNAQASRRLMEKQQKSATGGNRRKSFRDRFMRPYKKPTPPPPPPSPPKTSKQLGVSARVKVTKEPVKEAKRQERGRSLTRAPLHESIRPKTKGQERGRSRTRDGLARSDENKSPNRSGEKLSMSTRSRVDPLLDHDEDEIEPVFAESEANRKLKHQPISIELKQMSRVSELSSPVAINRQESLGNDSIRGVRQALQKMELELEKASAGGKRVSRDKIMNALNFMANSLHHEEQKKALKKELGAWIDESVVGSSNPGVRIDIDDEEYYSDGETLSSDDCSSTFDPDGFDDDTTKESTLRQQNQSNLPFRDLMSRLGKFFTVTEEDQKAVQSALGDLIWRELMGERNGQSGINQCLRKIDEVNASFDESEFEETEGDLPTFDPLECDVNYSKGQKRAARRGRTWWRKHGGNKKGGHLLEWAPSEKISYSNPPLTGRNNPRDTSDGAKAKSVRSRKGSKSKNSIAGALSESAKTTHKTLRTTRFAMDESVKESVGFSSLEGSEFWRHGDRYTAQNDLNATNQTNYAGHYKLAYSSNGRPNFEEEFLKSSPEDDDDFDDWDDSCLHSAENLSSPQTEA